uniref:Uncharacterized protein n=1 Tax=Nelumbo nucifera TaxID=4432 RepID=A0A822XSS9_NELNU|nr:TPA_asm: hypothetical protein HUJ06_023612 [Nelumbo nucifera]
MFFRSQDTNEMGCSQGSLHQSR